MKFLVKSWLILLLSFVNFCLQAQTIHFDIEPGKDNSGPRFIGNVPGGIIFSANYANIVDALWFTDGTNKNTFLLSDEISGKVASGIAPPFLDSNMTLLFVNNPYNQIWRTDGTKSGTYKLMDIVSELPQEKEKMLIKFKNKIYFSAMTYEGYDICITDGTKAGTKGIIDIGNSRYGIPKYLNVCNNKLYFARKDSSNRFSLFESDGTQAGTKFILNIENLASKIVSKDDMLYFSCDFGTNSVVYRFNPAILKLEIVFSSSLNRLLNELIIYNDRLYFNTYDSKGQKCWYTDSLIKNVAELKLSDTSVHSSRLVYTIEYPDFTIGLIQTDKYGYEYWKMNEDGSSAQFILDFTPGPSSNIDNLMPYFYKGSIYFRIIQPFKDTYIWSTDGSTENSKIEYIFQNNLSVNGLYFLNDTMFLMGMLDSKYGDEIYKMEDFKNSLYETVNVYDVLFPNPATAGHILQIQNTHRIETIRLYGLNGKLIQEIKDTNEMMLPEHLAAGMYIIQYISEGQNYRKKILVE